MHQPSLESKTIEVASDGSKCAVRAPSPTIGISSQHSASSSVLTNIKLLKRIGNSPLERMHGGRRKSLAASWKSRLAGSPCSGKGSGAPERHLQATGKRRRYMRRGSKSPSMLRGTGIGKITLPLHLISSSRTHESCLDNSLHSTCSTSTTWTSQSSSKEFDSGFLSLPEDTSSGSFSVPETTCGPPCLSQHHEDADTSSLQAQTWPFPEEPSSSTRKHRPSETAVSILSSALELSTLKVDDS